MKVAKHWNGGAGCGVSISQNIKNSPEKTLDNLKSNFKADPSSPGICLCLFSNYPVAGITVSLDFLLYYFLLLQVGNFS